MNLVMTVLAHRKRFTLFGYHRKLPQLFSDVYKRQEVYEATVPDEVLTDEDEDILNYDDLDDPDAFV